MLPEPSFRALPSCRPCLNGKRNTAGSGRQRRCSEMQVGRSYAAPSRMCKIQVSREAASVRPGCFTREQSHALSAVLIGFLPTHRIGGYGGQYTATHHTRRLTRPRLETWRAISKPEIASSGPDGFVLAFSGSGAVAHAFPSRSRSRPFTSTQGEFQQRCRQTIRLFDRAADTQLAEDIPTPGPDRAVILERNGVVEAGRDRRSP